MEAMKLYYSPGAVSLAVHIVARELELDVELVPTPTGEEAHRTAEYLAVHPLGRVPALRFEGHTLTETPAILRFLAGLAPSPKLYPEGRWARARADELMSRISSLAHPAYRMALRPDRAVADPAAHDAVRAAGARDFGGVLDVLEAELADEGWALGGQMSVVDPYLAVLWLWSRYLVPAAGERRPRLRRLSRQVLSRPAARAAMRAEGLVDDAGRPTPPARV